MKIKELVQTEICYFRFDVEDIPFQEAGIDFNYKYGYARFLNNKHTHNILASYFLCGIYNYFTNEPIKDFSLFKEKEFIMPQHLCTLPLMRGEYKWTLLGSEPIPNNIDLPHMSSTPSQTKDDDVGEYYLNGLYVATFIRGVNLTKERQTLYKYIKHLEETSVISAHGMRIGIYVELLKKTGKKFTEDKLYEKLKIFYAKLWDTLTPHNIKVEFHELKRLYNRQCYLDIPIRYREKAISYVDNLDDFQYDLKIEYNVENKTGVIEFNKPSFIYKKAILKITRYIDGEFVREITLNNNDNIIDVDFRNDNIDKPPYRIVLSIDDINRAEVTGLRG